MGKQLYLQQPREKMLILKISDKILWYLWQGHSSISGLIGKWLNELEVKLHLCAFGSAWVTATVRVNKRRKYFNMFNWDSCSEVNGISSPGTWLPNTQFIVGHFLSGICGTYQWAVTGALLRAKTNVKICQLNIISGIKNPKFPSRTSERPTSLFTHINRTHTRT